MIKTVFHFFCFFDRIVFLPLSSFRSAVYRLCGQPSVSISIDRSLSLSGFSLLQFLFSNKNDHIFIHIGSLYSKTNKATSTCSWLRCFFLFFPMFGPIRILSRSSGDTPQHTSFAIVFSDGTSPPALSAYLPGWTALHWPLHSFPPWPYWTAPPRRSDRSRGSLHP